MLVIAGTRTNSRRLRTFIEKPSDESEDRIRIRLLVKTVRKNLEFIIFTFLSFLHCSGSHTLDKDDQSNYRPIFNLSVKSNWASRPMGQVTQVRPYMARLLDVLSRPSRTCGHDRSGQVGHWLLFMTLAASVTRKFQADCYLLIYCWRIDFFFANPSICK